MDENQKANFVWRLHDVVNNGVFNTNMTTPPAGQQVLIEKAALLSDWQPIVYTEPCMVTFSGVVTGSEVFADGHRISTSEVVWVDWRWRWIRTQNSFYRLADQAGADDREDDGGDTPRT